MKKSLGMGDLLINRSFRKKPRVRVAPIGSSAKHRVCLSRQMVARRVRPSDNRQKHPRDAASAQYRAGRSELTKPGKLRRAHLDQSDQVQVRRRSLSGQFQARNHLGACPATRIFASLPDKPDHVLVLVPARFAVQGHPRRRGGPGRPLGDHRNIRLQRN